MAKHFRVTARPQIKAGTAAAPVKNPRFSSVAYTGAAIKLDGFDFPLVIDLNGLTANSQTRPVLYDHICGKDNAIGQTTAIRNSRKQLDIDGFLLGHKPLAKEIIDDAREGYVWQNSVGCDIPNEETDLEFVAAGESVSVNGQSHIGPLFVARRTVLGELSFVVIGADDRTSARIAARRANAAQSPPARKQIMTFEEWLKSLKMDGVTFNEEQMAAMQQTYDKLYPAEVVAEGEEEEIVAEGDEEEVKAVKAVAGKKRIAASGMKSITAARAAGHRKIVAIEAAAKGDSEIAAKALELGWDAERVGNEVELKSLRAGRGKAPGAASGGSSLDINAKVMEAALLLNIKTDEKSIGKHFDEKTMNVAMSREWRGTSLHVLMDQVIQAAGDHFSGSRKSDAFINAASRANYKIQANGFSTVSLSQILENVANKTLIASYEAQETIWQMFCAVRPLNDFKIHSYYRLDMEGAFKKVGPDGELKHLKPTDAKYTNQLDTYGAMLTLTRTMQIDDDLNAFAMLPKAIGRLASLRPEEAFLVLLLSNANNFFHANNRNKLTGAGSALGIPGLTAAKTQYKKQVDSNGKPILVTPDRILSGVELSVMAENLNVEQSLTGGTAADKINRNPHKGKYAPYDSPYIDNDGITDQDGAAISGQSATLWYLFCDPNVRAAFAMGFLNGNQTPFFRTKEAVPGILGTTFESFMDFGVGQEDPYAAQLNVGA